MNRPTRRDAPTEDGIGQKLCWAGSSRRLQFLKAWRVVAPAARDLEARDADDGGLLHATREGIGIAPFDDERAAPCQEAMTHQLPIDGQHHDVTDARRISRTGTQEDVAIP